MCEKVVDLKKYRDEKKFFGCSPTDGTIWRCNCGEELFWLSDQGFQCYGCENVTLFKDWNI